MKPKLTRRKFIIGSSTAVIAPSFVGISTGQTSSGNIELTADVTIPANTQILIEIFEDLDSDGVADNSQEISINDGVNTYEFTQLSGFTNESNIYWIDIQLSTTNELVTPEVDSLEITLPEEPSTPTPTPTPTATPVESRESSATDRLLTPNQLTTEMAILLTSIFAVLTYANVKLRNILVMVGWGLTLISLFAIILLNLSFIWLWISVLITFCLILLVTSNTYT